MKHLTAIVAAFLLGVTSMFAQVDMRASMPSGEPLTGVKLPFGGDTWHLRQNSNGIATTPGVFNVSAHKSVKTMVPPASGADFYGWLVYKEPAPSSIAGYGPCLMGTDGSYTPLGYGAINSFDFPGFFIRDGKLCTYGEWVYYGALVRIFYVEYDMNTGNLVRELQCPSLEQVNVLRNSAYDSKHDFVYGYTYASKAGGASEISFVKIDLQNPTEVLHIADVPDYELCLALTYNADEDELIGINQENEFVRIDRVSGMQTILETFSIKRNERKEGLCWSPKDGKYLWSVNTTYPSESLLLTIDPKTYEVERMAEFSNYESFSGFFCTDTAEVAPDAPADATVSAINFPAGARSGNIVYTMPALTGNGNPILGNVDYTFYLDGEVYKTGSAPAGSDVTINFDSLEQGPHSFKLVVSLNGVEGRGLKHTDFYIGNDTPIRPENVTMDADGVHWDACDKGIYNGYVDPEKLSYNVFVNNSLVGRNVKGTSFEYAYPEGQELTVYTAEVQAVCNGYMSEISKPFIFAYGKPLSLPVTIEPNATQQYLFTQIDNTGENRPQYQWQFYTLPDGTGSFHKNNSYINNHWLFLPAVALDDAECLYSFSMEAGNRSGNFSERFEVFAGTAPTVEAMNIPVIPTTVATNRDFAEFSNDFQIPEGGTYYIGIHCNSNPGTSYLFVHNFKLAKSAVSVRVPGVPTELKATPAANGELKATVQVTLPTVNAIGRDLDPSEQLTAEVTCSNNGEKATATGLPGETVSATVATVTGDNIINVCAVNSEGAGKPESVSIYCGLDIPMAPADFKITTSDDNMAVVMTWSAPTEGVNGGYVAPEGIDYYFAQYNSETGEYEFGDLIGRDVYTATYELPAGSLQKVISLGVLARNATGRGTQAAAGSVVAGTPFTLPMRENFAGGLPAYTPVVTYQVAQPTGAVWAYDIPGRAGRKYALPDGEYAYIGRTTLNSDKSRFGLPKFSTVGIANPSIFLNLYVGAGADVEVFAQTPDMEEPISIGRLADKNLAEGYQVVEFDLPAQFRDKKAVAIYAEATFSKSSDLCIIASYEIKDAQEQDLAVFSLHGSEAAYTDTKATFTATVLNDGVRPMAFGGGLWKVEDNAGNIVAQLEVDAQTEEIEPGKTIELEFSFVPTAEMDQNLTVSFTLTGADMVVANNSMSLDIFVTPGNDIIVSDLHAVDAGEGFVELEWTEPELAGGHESFESEKAFVQSPSTLGQFRNIDGDKAIVYANNNVNHPNKHAAGAFTVWSQKELPDDAARERFAAADGDKYLLAYCPDITKKNVDADDWLISPEVMGDTEVAFAARAITHSYGAEIIEVMYSSTDREPESFKVMSRFEIDGAKNAVPTWERVSCILPADAKYFAIHYASHDIMGIMIDDITWTPWYADTQLDGYDIYRDGQCIRTNEFAPGYFRDEEIGDTDANYDYYIVPVLRNGKRGAASNIVSVRPSGVVDVVNAQFVTTAKNTIIVNGCEGANVIIFATDGKTIAADKNVAASKLYNVEPGIYTVVVSGRTHKVIVP